MDFDDLLLWENFAPPGPDSPSQKHARTRRSACSCNAEPLDLDNLLADLDGDHCSTAYSTPVSTSSHANYRSTPSHATGGYNPVTGICMAPTSLSRVSSTPTSPSHGPLSPTALQRSVTPLSPSPYRGAALPTSPYGLRVDPEDDLLASLLPSCEVELYCDSGFRERAGRYGVREEDPIPTPRSDTRGPVQDDYDVTHAIEDYRNSHRNEHPEEHVLTERVRLLCQQADALSGPSRSEHVDTHARERYCQVRAELLEEIKLVEEQLAALARGEPLPDTDTMHGATAESS